MVIYFSFSRDIRGKCHTLGLKFIPSPPLTSNISIKSILGLSPIGATKTKKPVVLNGRKYLRAKGMIF